MSGYIGRQIGRVLFYITAGGVFALDQVTKAAARSILEYGREVDVVPGLFSLRLTTNTGAAFGFLNDVPLLLTLAGIAAVLLIIGLRRERSRSRLVAVSLGLMLAGVLGNLTDRLIFGHVTDFLDFAISIRGSVYSWPTFNVADIAITAGVILLAGYVIFADGQAGDEKSSNARINN